MCGEQRVKYSPMEEVPLHLIQLCVLSYIPTCRNEAAKASWELLSRVRNWLQMLLANLEALRLSMASWATFLFHSSVMAGGLTHVMRWMICQEGDSENTEGWETETSRKNQGPSFSGLSTLKIGCTWSPTLLSNSVYLKIKAQLKGKHERTLGLVCMLTNSVYYGQGRGGPDRSTVSHPTQEPDKIPEKQPHSWPPATKPGSEKTFRLRPKNMKKLQPLSSAFVAPKQP